MSESRPASRPGLDCQFKTSGLDSASIRILRLAGVYERAEACLKAGLDSASTVISERERERERERESERTRQRDSERARERARQGERERESDRESELERGIDSHMDR